MAISDALRYQLNTGGSADTLYATIRDFLAASPDAATTQSQMAQQKAALEMQLLREKEGAKLQLEREKQQAYFSLKQQEFEAEAQLKAMKIGAGITSNVEIRG